MTHYHEGTDFQVAHYISNMVKRIKDGTETDIIRINAISFYERYFKEVEQNEVEWTEELETLLLSDVKKVTVCIEKPNGVSLLILRFNVFSF